MKRTLEVFGEKLEVMILEVLANVVMKDGFKRGWGGGPKAVGEGGGGNRGMPRRTRQNGALSTGRLATLCPYGEPVPGEIWWPLFRWVP